MDTLRAPSRIYIDVTNACVLQCLHCCSESGSACEQELTSGEIVDLIDQTVSLEVRNLVISGGEPMLRPDLLPIIDYARTKSLNVTLLTSGVLIDRRAADEFARLKVRVKISLDGITAATHELLRGRGSFEKALQGLLLLREAGVEERAVHFTVHRKNIAELPGLGDFLPPLGIRNIVVGTIKPSGRARANEALLIAPSMAPYVRSRILEIWGHRSLTFQNFTDKEWEGFGCPAVCNKFGITASGRSTTCVFFGSELLGASIRDHTLKELWAAYQGQRTMFVPSRQCSDCPDLAHSGGGCRARAFYYHGDWNSPDPFCCALRERRAVVAPWRHLVESGFPD